MVFNRIKGRSISDQIIFWGTGLVALNAVLLCLFHYFSFRSLWLDEAFVAVNLQTDNVSSLFTGLEYDQQFPRLYLLGIYALTQIFGYEIWVLRLLPLLFGIAGILLGSAVLWKEFKLNHFYLAGVAVALFLANHFLYYFAGDLKQYSADIFFALFGYWWAKEKVLPAWERGWGSFLLVSFAWIVPSLLSLTYLFCLAAVGLAVFRTKIWPLTREHMQRLGALVGMGLVFAAFTYWLDLRHTGSGTLLGYWSGFFISGETPWEALQSAWQGASNILGRWWTEPTTVPFVGLALLGLGRTIYLFIKNKIERPVTLAAAFLFAELLILAALKRYPLEYGRTALFFYPFACALIMEGLVFLVQFKWAPLRWAGMGAVGLVALIALGWKLPMNSKNNYRPWHWENLNPAMEEISKRGDIVVVYSTGAYAQVRAMPRLPSQADFIRYEDALATIQENSDTPLLQSDFLFLRGVPTTETDDFLAFINEFRPFQVEPIGSHLYLFSPQPSK